MLISFEFGAQITLRQFCQAAIGLIVCNLLVVVTCVYRRLRNGEELEVSTTTENTSGPPLTTITMDRPMTTASFSDVSGLQHTFDTHYNSVQDDSVGHGANSAARSDSAVIQCSSKTD